MPGLDAVVNQYAAYGPLAAAFLANLLATFGDKGQLVVVTLAARYDARRVFAGAMAAFAGWSALEVALGAWVTRVVPADLVATGTGAVFLVFALVTAYGVAQRVRAAPSLAVGFAGEGPEGTTPVTDGAGEYLPGFAAANARVATAGPVLTSFVFVGAAEFGDKTQLLTINLAATFPDAPLAVFVGVVAALGLRTGIDAVLGEQAERWIPGPLVETAAAVVFAVFGLAVFGVVSGTVLLAAVGFTVVGAGLGAAWLARRVPDRPTDRGT